MKIPSNLVKDIRKYYCNRLLSLYDENEANTMILMLLEHYFDIDRIQMALNPDLRLNESELLTLHFAVKELMKHRPIQYVMGETFFCDFTLKVNENVLIPRPETSEMVKMIINTCQSDNILNIIDIGTGSGCIAISMAKAFPKSNVYALDNSEQALDVARQNARNNNVKVSFLLADIMNPVIFKSRDDIPKFDLIVSNPPYVRESEKKKMCRNVLDWEPSKALFVPDNDALVFYRAILRFAKNRLNDNGKIWFEINEALGNETKGLCQENGFNKVSIINDFKGKERFLVVLRQ